MMRYTRFQTMAVILLALCGFLYSMPSVMTPEQREGIRKSLSFLPSWIVPHQAIVLGLDLQGGSHVLLEVDTASIIRTQINSLRDDVRRMLREEKISLAGGIAQVNRGVSVRVSDANDRQRLLGKMRDFALGPIATRTGSAPLMAAVQRCRSSPSHSSSSTLRMRSEEHTSELQSH